MADALTDLRETNDDLPGALVAAEQALAVDPYDEAVYRQVMRFQARHGRPDAVARAYRLLERRLLDLDAEPEPLTRQLLAELAPHRRGKAAPRKDLAGVAEVAGEAHPCSAARTS